MTVSDVSFAADVRPRRVSANRSLRAIGRYWWVVCVCTLVGAVCALGYSLNAEPIYKSTAVLYVTAGGEDSTAAAYQGSLASQQRVMSYAKLIESDAVVQEALTRSGADISLTEARASLTASAPADTVLLSVSAQNDNPVVAARLANGAADAMVDYVAKLEAPDSGGTPLAKVTVVTPAKPSSSPVSPDTVRNIVVGCLVGFVVGLVGLVSREVFTGFIRTEDQLSEVSLSPVLGAIPNDSRVETGLPLDFAGGASDSAEAFRKLRSALEFSRVDDPVTVVGVTSALAGEGKTTTAVNLAAASAASGRRALLIDADLRRSEVAVRLRVSGDVGLTTWLRDGGEVSDFIQPTGVQGLDVLVAGPVAPNPSELLDSGRLGELLKEVSERYDFVVVDTAPIGPVADTLGLVSRVDGIVLVASARIGRVGPFLRSTHAIESRGGVVLGSVLANCTRADGSFGVYGGYYQSDVSASDS